MQFYLNIIECVCMYVNSEVLLENGTNEGSALTLLASPNVCLRDSCILCEDPHDLHLIVLGELSIILQKLHRLLADLGAPDDVEGLGDALKSACDLAGSIRIALARLAAPLARRR